MTKEKPKIIRTVKVPIPVPDRCKNPGNFMKNDGEKKKKTMVQPIVEKP